MPKLYTCSKTGTKLNQHMGELAILSIINGSLEYFVFWKTRKAPGIS